MKKKIKHKILEIYYDKWHKASKTKGKHNLTLGDLNLTIEEVYDKIKLKKNIVDEIIDILEIEGFISINNYPNKIYFITEKGRKAYLEKTILNKIWYRNKEFWKFILPFIIGLLGLLNSIYQWLIIK